MPRTIENGFTQNYYNYGFSYQNNTFIQVATHFHDKGLNIVCDDGYTSSGTSICQLDGTWNPVPRCFYGICINTFLNITHHTVFNLIFHFCFSTNVSKMILFTKLFPKREHSLDIYFVEALVLIKVKDNWLLSLFAYLWKCQMTLGKKVINQVRCWQIFNQKYWNIIIERL